MRTLIWSDAFAKCFKRWLHKGPDLRAHDELAKRLEI
jgi:hypothetical protein